MDSKIKFSENESDFELSDASDLTTDILPQPVSTGDASVGSSVVVSTKMNDITHVKYMAHY